MACLYQGIISVKTPTLIKEMIMNFFLFSILIQSKNICTIYLKYFFYTSPSCNIYGTQDKLIQQ